MSGLRFAMVTTFYPPYNFGGDGIAVQRLSQGLVARGHHVTVIHDADAYNLQRQGPEPLPGNEADGVEIVTLRSQAAAVSCLLTQQTGRPVINRARLDALLAPGRFDVIVYHNVSLVGGPGVLAMGHGVKLYMAHEHWLVCPTHVLWRHGREPCPARECLRCQLHHRRPPQLWRETAWFRRQLAHVDAFIALSEFSRSKHREFGFPQDMEVVPSFLPPGEVSGGDGTSLHPRPYFLFVGRLERIKGLDDVIPVFRDYEGADLLIAGEGEHGDALRALGSGVPGVHFLGRLAPEDLARFYRHAVALLVPSVCFETFGIIIIEAFRQGTPVIARDIGPFPEIVNRAGAGALFRTPGDLVDAMRRLESDPALRAEASRLGREAFERYWSEGVVLPQFLAVVRRAALARGLPRVAEAAHPG